MLLYKYRSLSQLEYALDILNAERLFCARYSELNDPFEGLFELEMHYPEPGGDVERISMSAKIEDLISSDMSPVRVCSLSSDPKDVRLWALYAGSCRGVAIEIDFGDSLQDVHEVHYGQALPTFVDSNGSPSVVEALTSKTNHWRYEQEYRIITDKEYWDISGKIRRVIAGPRCTPADCRLLAKIAPKSVEIVQSEIDRTQVTIEILKAQ